MMSGRPSMVLTNPENYSATNATWTGLQGLCNTRLVSGHVTLPNHSSVKAPNKCHEFRLEARAGDDICANARPSGRTEWGGAGGKVNWWIRLRTRKKIARYEFVHARILLEHQFSCLHRMNPGARRSRSSDQVVTQPDANKGRESGCPDENTTGMGSAFQVHNSGGKAHPATPAGRAQPFDLRTCWSPHAGGLQFFKVVFRAPEKQPEVTPLDQTSASLLPKCKGRT